MSAPRVARLTGSSPAGVGKLILWGEGAAALLAALGGRDLRADALSLRALADAEGAIDAALCRRRSGPLEAIELCPHGGAASLALAEALIRAGAQAAEPLDWLAARVAAGELTRAAAEAELAIARARSPLALDAALTQRAGALGDLLAAWAAGEAVPEAVASLRAAAALGRALFAPRRLLLLGAPNAGKSSLFNRWLGDDRALTAAEPGTTRDWLAAELVLAGVPHTLIDTPSNEAAARELIAPDDWVLWLGGEGSAASEATEAAGAAWLELAPDRPLADVQAILLADLADELARGVQRPLPVHPAQWELLAQDQPDVAVYLAGKPRAW